MKSSCRALEPLRKIENPSRIRCVVAVEETFNGSPRLSKDDLIESYGQLRLYFIQVLWIYGVTSVVLLRLAFLSLIQLNLMERPPSVTREYSLKDA